MNENDGTNNVPPSTQTNASTHPTMSTREALTQLLKILTNPSANLATRASPSIPNTPSSPATPLDPKDDLLK